MAARKPKADAQAAAADKAEINVLPISEGQISFNVIVRSPLICHTMALKAQRDLLAPPKRATTDADRAARGAKHDPATEFRDSMDKDYSTDGPTRVVLPATAFKSAIASAALDMPGSKKAEIGRLLWVHGEKVPVWGIPEVHMGIVRMADIGKTPDVRTRAILREWATTFTVSFIRPKLNEQSVINLLAGAGIIRGVGDNRQEKGKGSFGMFRLVDADDAQFVRLQQTAGREAQDAAIGNPTFYDGAAEELYSWFYEHGARRMAAPKAAPAGAAFDLDNAETAGAAD